MTATLFYPVQGFRRYEITMGFLDKDYPDFREKSGFKDRDQHPAIDLGVIPGDGDRGHPLYAVADGRLDDKGEYKGFGFAASFDHPADPDSGRPRFWSQYAHLDKTVKIAGVVSRSPFLDWAPGHFVQAGDLIGGMGDGDPRYDMACHLHFELRKIKLSAGRWYGADYAGIQRDFYSPLDFFLKYGARDRGDGELALLHARLVTIRAGLMAWLRTNAPDTRLVTVRTYAARSLTGGKLGPHNLRPALAFDYRLKREDKVVALSDSLYERAGKQAVILGGAWGGATPEAVRGETAQEARAHIELPNAGTMVKQREAAIAAGNTAGVNNEVDPVAAAAGSTDTSSTSQTKPECVGGSNK